MSKRIYYYRYDKLTGDVKFTESTLKETPNRSIIDNRNYYYTYSYFDRTKALVDIMEYINKRNG